MHQSSWWILQQTVCATVCNSIFRRVESCAQKLAWVLFWQRMIVFFWLRNTPFVCNFVSLLQLFCCFPHSPVKNDHDYTRGVKRQDCRIDLVAKSGIYLQKDFGFKCKSKILLRTNSGSYEKEKRSKALHWPTMHTPKQLECNRKSVYVFD